MFSGKRTFVLYL